MPARPSEPAPDLAADVLAMAPPGTRKTLAWRLAVTALVLAFYQAGMMVAAPGVNAYGLLGGGANGAVLDPNLIARMSVFALGVVPFLTAQLFGELIKLAFAGMNDWIIADARNRTAFNRRLHIFALLIAALQAYGVAVALEALQTNSVYPNVVDLGTGLKGPFIATLVAATALLIWLADVITRHGIGSGLWVLLIWPSIGALLAYPAQVTDMARIGQVAPVAIIAIVVLLLATAAATAFLTRRWMADVDAADPATAQQHAHRLDAAAGIIVWPVLIGAMLAGWMLAASPFVTGWLSGVHADGGAPFSATSVVVASLVLTPLITLLMTRAYADAYPTPHCWRGALIGATIAVQVAALALFETVMLSTNLPLPIAASDWLALVVVITLALPPALSAAFTRMVPLTDRVETISDDDFAAR